MKKTAITLMIITILSKILGFTRDIILSYFYGASDISDAYLISITIPITIFTFIGNGISTSYTPMYSNIKNKNGTQVADDFTSKIINFTFIISTILVLLGFIFTEEIVKLFASGFKGEIVNLTIIFTRISLFGIYFSGIVFVLSAYLRINNKFIIPALIGIPLNLVTIIAIALSSKLNIFFLAIGNIISIASQLLLLVPFVLKEGYKYKLIINLKDSNTKKMLILSLPVILGTSVNQINILVDRTIASRIVEGGISALNYAHRLDSFIQGIFVLSLATIMYPMISKMAAKRNIKELKNTVSETISGIGLLVIPATIGSMIFAEPVVKLLFGRGAFGIEAIVLTSNALYFYAIGMIGFGLREVLSRVFYSLQDTKTPMINAAIGMGLNIILNIILSRIIGIGGLALATSISALVTTVLLFISLRNKIGSFGIKNILISFLKILLASMIMGGVSKMIFIYLNNNISQNISLIFAVITGAILYFTIIFFMKIDEVDSIVNNIRRVIKRK